MVYIEEWGKGKRLLGNPRVKKMKGHIKISKKLWGKENGQTIILGSPKDHLH